MKKIFLLLAVAALLLAGCQKAETEAPSRHLSDNLREQVGQFVIPEETWSSEP